MNALIRPCVLVAAFMVASLAQGGPLPGDSHKTVVYLSVESAAAPMSSVASLSGANWSWHLRGDGRFVGLNDESAPIEKGPNGYSVIVTVEGFDRATYNAGTQRTVEQLHECLRMAMSARAIGANGVFEMILGFVPGAPGERIDFKAGTAEFTISGAANPLTSVTCAI